MQIEGL
jgi:uncharacterized circularly permuted ATP-grasp superfamily protein